MEYVFDMEGAGQGMKVFLMENSDEIEREKFLESFYRSFGPRYNFDENWFNWYYLKNPAGRVKNYILIDKNEEFIGAFGYAPGQSKLKGVSVKTMTGINGFINPGFTGLGLYSQLMERSLNHLTGNNDLSYSFPHGKNFPSIRGHEKSGWKLFKKLNFFVLDQSEKVNPSAKIEKLPEDIGRLKNYSFKGSSDEVFEKNYNTIKWRFYDRPDKSYNFLLEENDHGEIEGFLVFRIYSNGNQNRCQIGAYDYMNVEAFEKLLVKAREYAIHCHTIEFLANDGHKDTQVLLKNGFVKNEEHYLMFVNGENAHFLPGEIKMEYGAFDVI